MRVVRTKLVFHCPCYLCVGVSCFKFQYSTDNFVSLLHLMMLNDLLGFEYRFLNAFSLILVTFHQQLILLCFFPATEIKFCCFLIIKEYHETTILFYINQKIIIKIQHRFCAHQNIHHYFKKIHEHTHFFLETTRLISYQGYSQLKRKQLRVQSSRLLTTFQITIFQVSLQHCHKVCCLLKGMSRCSPKRANSRGPMFFLVSHFQFQMQEECHFQ